MTSKQKSKGYRYEKKTEELLNAIPGVTARRSLASGAYGRYDASLDGDVQAVINDTTYKVEVKARSRDFPLWLEGALGQGDLVALWKCGEGRARGYLLMPIEMLGELLQ